MSDDDELSEEQQRNIEAKLFGYQRPKPTVVETRRSKKPRPEPLEIRFIRVCDKYSGEFVYCEVHQKASSGWVKFETYHDEWKAASAADKYARKGDRVSWARRLLNWDED